MPHGALSSRVKEIAWDSNAKCSLKSVTLKDEFIHFYGSHNELLAQHGISAKSIENFVNK